MAKKHKKSKPKEISHDHDQQKCNISKIEETDSSFQEHISSPSKNLHSFTEDEGIGDTLLPGLIDPQKKKFFLRSGCAVIEYDLTSGERSYYFKQSSTVVGLHWIGNLLGIYTAGKEFITWDVVNRCKISHSILKSPQLENCSLLWTYDYNHVCGNNQSIHYILGSNDIDTDVNANEIHEKNSPALIFRIKFSEEELSKIASSEEVKPELVLTLRPRPRTYRHLALGLDFAVLCHKRQLSILNFACEDPIIEVIAGHQVKRKRRRSRSNSGSHNLALLPFAGRSEYTLTTLFDVQDQTLVEFDGVVLSGDNLFTSLNIGRLYEWSGIRVNGLDSSKRFQVTLFSTDFKFLVSKAHQTVYFGTSSGLLTKYNLVATSGSGRWHPLEQSSFGTPIRDLALSLDDSLLLVILDDNEVFILKTATMEINTNSQTLCSSLVPPLQWLGILTDPAQPDYLITNAKLGWIQWFDPIRWQTVAMHDISEENVTHRDTFNAPNYQWLNIYLACVTVSSFVTCECRRNNKDKTYVKFHRRMRLGTVTDMKNEDCHILDKRIAYIRSTSAEIKTIPIEIERINMLYQSEQFVLITEMGVLDVYMRDPNRSGRWCLDSRRSGTQWNDSFVTYCSTIRKFDTAHLFITVNKIPADGKLADEQIVILVWQLSNSVLAIMDKPIISVARANQVEWAPISAQSPDSSLTSVILICSDFGIAAYDILASNFLWTVLQQGLSLSSNSSICFAFDAYNVYQFSPDTGLLLNSDLKFSQEQIQVISFGHPGNLRFLGIARNGKLAVLRQDVREEIPEAIVSEKAKANTPFANLFKSEPAKDGTIYIDPKRKIIIQHQPSVRKLFDGPAYALAPITTLASIYIKACLLPKSSTG